MQQRRQCMVFSTFEDTMLLLIYLKNRTWISWRNRSFEEGWRSPNMVQPQTMGVPPLWVLLWPVFGIYAPLASGWWDYHYHHILFSLHDGVITTIIIYCPVWTATTTTTLNSRLCRTILVLFCLYLLHFVCSWRAIMSLNWTCYNSFLLHCSS